MKLINDVEINSKGHLVLGGCDAVELAREFGTPLYVMEENRIRSVARAYVGAIRESGLEGSVKFASKAFLNTAMCKLIQSEGVGFDVASGGELYVVLNAGVSPADIYMHGNNKLPVDILEGVRAGVACIVADSISELRLIESVCAELDKPVNVAMRLKPGIDAHTHDYIKTATEDSKFGMGLTDGTAIDGARLIAQSNYMRFYGIHCHIGSQILETQPFYEACEIMTDFALEIKKYTGLDTPEIDLGGGLGIQYTADDDDLNFAEIIGNVAKRLKQCCEKKGIPPVRMSIEPGRSIVGRAGTTLYTVGAVKESKQIRTYAVVDGGMADNPRVALYQAKYTACAANKANAPDTRTLTIAGRCCESELLIKDIEMPELERGDILAVFSTGAYNFSMASNYNKLPFPACVLVKDGKAALISRRQTYKELTQYDCVPEWI